MTPTTGQTPTRRAAFLVERTFKRTCARAVLAARRLQRRSTGGADVIVSLTTTPTRAANAALVVDALRLQTVLPERIVVYLAREEFGAARPTGLEARAGDRVSIRWVERNTRSYKKLIHALADFPGKTVVTVDDDMLYAPDLIERLVAGARAHPGCVVFGRGRRMIHDGERFAPYSSWAHVEEATAPSLWLSPIGCGGVLYPPGALSPMADDHEVFQRLAPLEDDIWFKAMSLLAATPCVGIAPGRSRNHGIPAHVLERLSYQNVRLGRGDEQARAVFDHFGLTPAAIAARRPPSGALLRPLAAAET